jgi:hypothetical protein
MFCRGTQGEGWCGHEARRGSDDGVIGGGYLELHHDDDVDEDEDEDEDEEEDDDDDDVMMMMMMMMMMTMMMTTTMPLLLMMMMRGTDSFHDGVITCRHHRRTPSPLSSPSNARSIPAVASVIQAAAVQAHKMEDQTDGKAGNGRHHERGVVVVVVVVVAVVVVAVLLLLLLMMMMLRALVTMMVITIIIIPVMIMFTRSPRTSGSYTGAGWSMVCMLHEAHVGSATPTRHHR